MITTDAVEEHLEKICTDAGLEIMAHALIVVRDREDTPDSVFLALTPDDITGLYEGWLEPALDNLERSLAGDYD